MTPEQKLEAIREELQAYTNGLKVAKEDFAMKNKAYDEWCEYEHWAREGADVDLEKIVEILNG